MTTTRKKVTVLDQLPADALGIVDELGYVFCREHAVGDGAAIYPTPGGSIYTRARCCDCDQRLDQQEATR